MEWKKFLVKFYNEKRDEDKDYSFKDAMKEAKGPYHKQLSGGADPIPETPPEQQMGGGKKKRSRKQLSGGADEVPLPKSVEETPPVPPVTGGKKSKSKRSSKRRRTSKKR